MGRAFGPILTTGVALGAAAVVVANPIVAPRADVQIPSVQLSAGTGDAVGMLDQAFLDAIAPPPPESTNPFSVLKQLITSLAADATYLGKNAIVDAFVAGVAAVSDPELTAATTPYIAPPAGSRELAMSVLPGLDLSSIAPVPDLAVALPNPASLVDGTFVGGTLAPALASFVTTLVSDAGYVGGEILAAAFAAGAVVVAVEPKLIGDTLTALINGDFNGAITNAVKAVIAPLGPPAIIVNALQTVIAKHFPGAARFLTSEPAAESPPAGDVPVPSVRVPSPPAEVSATDQQTRTRGNPPPVVQPVLTDLGGPQPAAAVGVAASVDVAAARRQADNPPDVESPDTTTDITGATTTVTPRRFAGVIGDAIAGIGERIGAAVDAAGANVPRGRSGRTGSAASG